MTLKLIGAYPDAKVLLSLRDADKWFESTQATIFNPAMSGMLLDSPLRTFFELTVWKDFGAPIHDRAFMVEYFRDHTAEVQRTVPRERLLVYDVAQGWEPLCRFLQVPVPDAPFPHVNTREEQQRMHEMLRAGPAVRETCRMNDVKGSEFIESQLKIAHWHLDKTADADPQASQYHVASARRAYRTLMELLPTIALSDKRRGGLVTDLTALRERSRIAGDEL